MKNGINDKGLSTTALPLGAAVGTVGSITGVPSTKSATY
eukprot:CAMPEP_0197447348 /NCGR_PEP_ID=MMETSP1175-20131217/12968_1 /TAXON_ID=1003142 /ORGANISM="Triceratium dubium, Strain CCMP147" /LENGTH=38 /DNA_ID= /DNA_START= /DNA_END= /DNA_ORIENTATION=